MKTKNGFNSVGVNVCIHMQYWPHIRYNSGQLLIWNLYHKKESKTNRQSPCARYFLIGESLFLLNLADRVAVSIALRKKMYFHKKNVMNQIHELRIIILHCNGGHGCTVLRLSLCVAFGSWKQSFRLLLNHRLF